MKVLGVIPARGGSKGILRKNLTRVCGRPLLAYTADAVGESARLTRTIVSTDDAQIADYARSLGLDVPFMRPSSLASDETPMVPVLQHAVDAMRAGGFDPEVVVLLQPTSPLRRGEHIDAAIETLQRVGSDSVVSVIEVPHQFSPSSVMQLDAGLLTPFLDAPTATRRQDKPKVFARNGPAVLAVRSRVIDAGSLYGAQVCPLIMSPEDSLDIDTPWDLKLAELIIAARANAHSV